MQNKVHVGLSAGGEDTQLEQSILDTSYYEVC
jgi:hypothetical protein